MAISHIFAFYHAPIRLSKFVIALCLVHLAFFQWPVLRYAISVSDFSPFQGILQVISLQILQICLLAGFMFLLSTISIRLMKLIMGIIVMCNALALYFMTTYGIVLDRTMIANILNTNTAEAGELWHISSLGYILFLGFIPACFIISARIRAPRRIWRLLSAIVMFVILIIWLFSTAFTLLWYDRHGSLLGSKLLPWSYVVNTMRYVRNASLNARDLVLLPTAHFIAAPALSKSDIEVIGEGIGGKDQNHTAQEAAQNQPAQRQHPPNPPEEKQVVVLVLGEAARADHFQLLGYPRETNPFTKDLDLAVFPIGTACATNTIASIACILTHEGANAPARTAFETLPSYLTRHGITTIARTNNSGRPKMIVDTYQTAFDIRESCDQDACANLYSDGFLSWRLGDMIEQSNANRIFVLIHPTGSHGPAYYTKYPKNFEHFTPVCETVQIATCTQQELINAYDNTLRFTDHLLASIISQLKSLKDTQSVMMYVPDHGQSLGENGFYLHGMPLSVAPKQQTQVPFLLWMSPDFKHNRGLTNKMVLRKQTYPHDFPFHSVMGAFRMRSDIYKPQFDIFNTDNRVN